MNGDTAVRGPGASQTAIRHHYDVGNDFYGLWLDASRTYSCGLWYGDEDIETAQINKIDWHLEHASARNAARLLDVGCGWGTMLRRAKEAWGVAHGVGLTLSEEQADWVRRTAYASIDVRLEAWADHVPQVPYDAIVSVGAFEHFARLDQDQPSKIAGYRAFFAFCQSALRPGGRLSLQTITYQNADRADFSPFFAEHIFPESDLPHLGEIVESLRGLFEIEILRNDREHYARTARTWLRALRARRAEAELLVGAEVVARYARYLGLLVVGFHTGSMNLVRIGMRRIDA